MVEKETEPNEAALCACTKVLRSLRAALDTLRAETGEPLGALPCSLTVSNARDLAESLLDAGDAGFSTACACLVSADERRRYGHAPYPSSHLEAITELRAESVAAIEDATELLRWILDLIKAQPESPSVQ